MRLDDAPSTSRIFIRPAPQGVLAYVEVRDVGVMVIPLDSDLVDPRGKVIPRGLKLLKLEVLDRLAQIQTPLPPPPDDPDPTEDPA
jgi:hypothetical protein